MQDKRKETRISSSRPIKVLDTDVKEYTALSMNYSKCGLAMVTNLDISPGDCLRVDCDSFWAEPQNAVVVWVRHLSSSHITTGLSLSV